MSMNNQGSGGVPNVVYYVIVLSLLSGIFYFFFKEDIISVLAYIKLQEIELISIFTDKLDKYKFILENVGHVIWLGEHLEEMKNRMRNFFIKHAPAE